MIKLCFKTVGFFLYKISDCNLLLIELYSKATCESEATATTNVLSVRKRSDSNKAPVGTEINQT